MWMAVGLDRIESGAYLYKRYRLVLEEQNKTKTS